MATLAARTMFRNEIRGMSCTSRMVRIGGRSESVHPEAHLIQNIQVRQTPGQAGSIIQTLRGPSVSKTMFRSDLNRYQE